jgi:hypothetical protein
MNPNKLTRHYENLTPEERFALIMNAAVRGDVQEQARLSSSAPRVTYAVSHHQPFAEAFKDLAEHLLLELLDLAGRHFDKLAEAREADHGEGDEDLDNEDLEDGDPDDEPADSGDDNEGPAAGDKDEDNSLSWQWLELALADGYMLKTKVAAWRLWCERRHLPPFAVWQLLPGWDRLRRALDHAEGGTPARPVGCAFVEEGMLRWLNSIRPKGAQELTELSCTPEGIADELEEMFQDRLRFYGGA